MRFLNKKTGRFIDVNMAILSDALIRSDDYIAIKDAEFKESEHPRDENGKFSSSGGSSTNDAYDYLKNHFGLEVERNKEYKKNPYSMGENAVLHLKNAKVQMTMNENEDGLYLSNIHVKNLQDLSKHEKGTGYGKEIIDSLKKYSEETKKPFYIIGATEGATKNFWSKIEGLERGSVTYKNPHGEEFTEENSYTYKPKL